MLKKLFFDLLPFFTGMIAGLVFISHPSLAPGLTHFPGDLADARFNNYILEHGYLFFSGQISEFWNAPFMFPEENVITYSDNFLGALPFYALFRLLNFDRETSFQLWFLLTSVMNYTAAYFLIRYLFKNSYAASVGAMIFAFSIALQSQSVHAQTYSRFIIPIAIWMALLFVRELKVKFFLWMGLCLVYQFYCSFYLGFMLSVPLVLMVLLSFYYRRGLYLLRIKSRNWTLKMGGSLLAIGLAMLPVLLPYLERARQMGFYPYEYIRESLPTPLSYVFSHPGSLFWDFINSTAVQYPAYWDHTIFPGGVAMICTFLCLLFILFRKQIRRPDFLVRIDLNSKLLLITAAITFLLFLRIGNFSLYRIIYPLPGFGSMRALQRIINIELIFLGIAAAFVVDLFLKKRQLVHLSAFFGIVVLVVLDNRVHPDLTAKCSKELSIKRVAVLKQKVGLPPLHGILSYEPDSTSIKPIYDQLDAMLAAQDLQMKTINGYTATAPKWYDGYWRRPEEVSRKAWLQGKGMSEKNILVIH